MKWFESTFRVWEDNSHSYAARLADALNEQRLVGSFCDVIVKVGDRTFPAHRGVLCAASRYFHGLLDGNFKEHGATEVDLSDSIEDSETLSVILDYIYTGKLKVEKDSYEKLLAGVSFLLLEDACHLMASFLLENLVLENCIGIMFLADRYSLHELSAVTFEIVSSRLHDYFIEDSGLKEAPLAILSRLAGIQAFNSVTEEDLLTFLKSYLCNYASCSSDERQLLGSFEEVIELFRDRNNDFDHEVTRQIYETFIRDCKTVEDLNLGEPEPLILLENSDTAEEQEVLCIVSAKLVDNDRVVLTIHTYFAHSSKWAHFAEINISKRDHRTFKNFIGIHHTGELLFSTEKRVAFVSRNGEVRYVNSCCFVCSRGVDLECKHYYFCFQRNLFSVVASIRGNIIVSESQNSSEWEKNNLAYILSVYDDSERDWIDIDEFRSDILLKTYMTDTGSEVTQYPEFLFDIHPQKECTWILATLKANDRNIDEGKNVEKDGGKIVVKLFKLVQDQEHDIFKLLDVQSSSVLENTGARKCFVRSTCDKNKLFVHSLVLADDPAFEPEILYYSGPMYTYDLVRTVWETYPWINTPTKNRELNPLRGRKDRGELNRDSSDKNSGPTVFEGANSKVFNVTFTSSIGSPGKEYKESGSIAPSQPLPLVEFKQRRKIEHEQLIRGTHSGRHIDTYQRKVYGTLLWRTELLPSNRYGSFYQVHILSPLVTELWQYNVTDMNWQYLPPPPVDTSIMHVSVCSLAMADLPEEQINGRTIKAAKFSYSDKNHDEFRPFTNYHLKTAHEKLFHRKQLQFVPKSVAKSN